MRLALADRTGAVTAIVWDGVQEASETARAGSDELEEQMLGFDGALAA
jgi:hypothetical protein